MFRSMLAALLITAARMVDVVAGKMVERPQVVVTDGRIVSVGQAGDTVPTGSRVVWLPGMTLLPGLIDMHVHPTSVAAIDGHRGLDYTNSFWTAAGVGNALKTLRADFTTVRNVGSANFDDVGLRQAIDQGYVPGPRIVAATWALGATGCIAELRSGETKQPLCFFQGGVGAVLSPQFSDVLIPTVLKMVVR